MLNFLTDPGAGAAGGGLMGMLPMLLICAGNASAIHLKDLQQYSCFLVEISFMPSTSRRTGLLTCRMKFSKVSS